MRPLYLEVDQYLTWHGGNAGLWYDKFCNEWRSDWSGLGDDGKKSWIGALTNRACGNEDQLEQAVSRMAMLLKHHSQTPLFCRLESDFVTGLGREHPVENGFAWHHILGTPYLPGSSVNGMVRAWAERWTDPKPNHDSIRRIFGPSADDIRNHEDVNATVGSVIFLDGLPAGPVQLKADIMTPHHGPYYQETSSQTPPADWHSPTPIPFLVVEQGQTFIFGIIPRRTDNQCRADCEKVGAWLKGALEWTGAGAKTAVGYGRFVLDTKAQQAFEQESEKRREEQQALEEEQRRQRELERRTEGQSELYTELYITSLNAKWREDKNAFSQAGLIEAWLDKLEVDPKPDAVALMHEFMQIHYGEVLADPDAMEGKKQTPKFKDRQRNFAKRMSKLLEVT